MALKERSHTWECYGLHASKHEDDASDEAWQFSVRVREEGNRMYTQLSERIEIRLRSWKNRAEFLSFAELMDMMLHELAHFASARHSRGFWDFLHMFFCMGGFSTMTLERKVCILRVSLSIYSTYWLDRASTT